MSGDRQRSFFSTTTGVLTGVAGVVTAIVGLITASVQLGWLGSAGDGKGGGTPATTTTVAVAVFTADPPRIMFEPLSSRETVVKVTNTSFLVPIAWTPFSVEGQFTATDVSCGARLEPGRTCEIRVRFTPPKAGDYTGRLILQPENGPAREVGLAGKSLL